MFTFQDGTLTGAAGNVNGNVLELDPYNQQVVCFQITQIGTNAVVNWEGSMDGTTWATIRVFHYGTGTGATTHNALMIGRNEGAYRYVRARVSAQTALSTIVKGRAVFGSLGTP